jgi:DNA gyrase subunit B
MSEDYDTSQIQVISSLEVVRKRPGMYFGTTDAKAIEQFIHELVSNVADCYLSDTATWVSVEIDQGTITVIDDGPGLPFDIPSDMAGISMATKFLTTMHFTGSEDGHAPHIHVKHRMGVGLAILNVCSSRLKIQTWRDDRLWEQEFSRGMPLHPARIVDLQSTIVSVERQGTKIEITPDPEIFTTVQPRSDVVRWHLLETAHLVSGLEIRFQRECFHAPQGLIQLLPLLSFIDRSDPSIPLHTANQPFQATLKSQNVSIDAVAYGYSDSSQVNIYSWVNGALSPAAGSHVTGFLAALAAVGWQPASLLIHVIMFDPEFAGPTRAQLAVPKIVEIVQSALLEPLQQHLLLLERVYGNDS